MATLDFKISLTVRDADSRVSDTDTKIISSVVPFARFSPVETSTDVFQVTASTYSIGSTYAWEFRDTDNTTVLASASTDVASHDFSSESAGTYYINLVVTEGNLTSSYNTPISVDGSVTTPVTCNPCSGDTAGVCAFEGARGFGAHTRHAYQFGTNPTIYQVENASELTTALQATGPRVIIFDAGGEYNIGVIEIMDDYLWVMGESAPNPVIIRGNWWHEDYSDGITMDHMYVSHITFVLDQSYTQSDTVSAKNLHNAIFDHCAFLFGTDECFDLVENCQNITVSNSIFSYGIQGVEDAKALSINESGPTSFIGNLFSNNVQRAPLAWGGHHYFANNRFYNMRRFSQFGSLSGSVVSGDIVNNIYKEGPIGTLWEGNPILGRSVSGGTEWQGTEQFNIVGNSFNGTIPANQNDIVGEMTGITIAQGVPIQYPDCEATLLVATANVDDDIDNIGPHPNARLTILQTAIDDYKNGTGITSAITNISQAGGYPSASTATTTHSLPANPHDDSGNGFTNLEVWAKNKRDALNN